MVAWLEAYFHPSIQKKYCPRWDWKLRGRSLFPEIHPPKWRYHLGLVFPCMRYYYQMAGHKNAAWNRSIIARSLLSHAQEGHTATR